MHCSKKFINLSIILVIVWTQTLKSNTDYTEFYFGDTSTPLVALGQEILNSNDIMECSPSNTAHINPHAFLKSIGLDFIDQIQEQPAMPPSQNRNFDNLLIGFPITTLSKRMAIGGVITDVYIPPDLQSSFAESLASYRLGRMRVRELRPRLTASKEGRCLLTFDTCSHRWNCKPGYQYPFFLQIPILGISAKHQALIFDPVELGIGLKKTGRLSKIKPLEQAQLILGLALDLGDPKTSIIDFANSSLIFDIHAQPRWRRVESLPQVTQRWFLKFDLVSSEEDFISRPPAKGVRYLLNTEERPSEDIINEVSKRIVRQRIFKDGQIKPVRYYVKNVSMEYQSAFQRAFEYWRSIFMSLISHPILSYEFIQGDFDKDGQEIITGDMRFNVIEWNSDRLEGSEKGSTVRLFNPTTGEIWYSYAIIYGDYFVDVHQKRFQYSKMVREGLLSSFQNNFDSQIQLFDQLTSFVQVQPKYILPITYQRGTFKSYIMGFVENLASHEIGHTLGLEHNYKGNIFGSETYASNTQMDRLSNKDGNKKISNDYDQMTIAYGYLGIPPYRTDMFCGNENLIYKYFNAPIKEIISPECAERDVGSNPLESMALEVREVVDLLTTESYIPSRPYLIWTNDIKNYVTDHITGILAYYFSADTYYDRLQSVLIDGRKPQSSQEVKDHVLAILKSFTCDPRLLEIQQGQASSVLDQRVQESVKWFLHWASVAVRIRSDLTLSDLTCS